MRVHIKKNLHFNSKFVYLFIEIFHKFFGNQFNSHFRHVIQNERRFFLFQLVYNNNI